MKQKQAFTLIELMVVIVILGILVSIGTFAFMSSQKKSRDSRRKSDLANVQEALEMYTNDMGTYPTGGLPGNDAGKIKGCDGGTTYCLWGGAFSNTTKVVTYMVKLPKDPMSDRTTYYYENVGGKGYRLYARLENLEDIGVPVGGTREYSTNCGSASTIYCNFAITSSNVVAPSLRP